MNNINFLQFLESKPDLLRIFDNKLLRHTILSASQAAIKISTFTKFSNNEAKRAGIKDIIEFDCVIRVACLLTSNLVI